MDSHSIYKLIGKEYGDLYLKMWDKQIKKSLKKAKKVGFSSQKNTIRYYHLSNTEKFEKQLCFRDIENNRMLLKQNRKPQIRYQLQIQNTHAIHIYRKERGYYVKRFFIVQAY